MTSANVMQPTLENPPPARGAEHCSALAERQLLPAPDLARGVWVYPDGRIEPFTSDDWLYLLN